VSEPLLWHPPYRSDLAGFVVPPTVVIPDWQLWFEDQVEKAPVSAPMVTTPLLLMH
jgi:hypothetical protein